MARQTCAACGRSKMKRFDGETFVIDHAGMRAEVAGLSGRQCGGCGEIQFDPESAARYAAAGDELVLRARRRQQEDIKRIRRKLGLSQREAARLTGGGHNAFSRYERGEASPLPAVTNLFRLLDNHPELLRELVGGARQMMARATAPTRRSGPPRARKAALLRRA